MNLVILQDTKLIHRSLWHLDANDKNSEREVKETIQITVISKRINTYE